MQVIAQIGRIAAFFNGWEVILILGVVLVLYGAKRLPDLERGLRHGFREFLRELMNVRDELDEKAGDAGKSLGGIYGKAACEALTPDNQTAELYDPAVLRHQPKPGGGTRNVWFLRWRRLFRRVSYFLSKPLNRKAA